MGNLRYTSKIFYFSSVAAPCWVQSGTWGHGIFTAELHQRLLCNKVFFSPKWNWTVRLWVFALSLKKLERRFFFFWKVRSRNIRQSLWLFLNYFFFSLFDMSDLKNQFEFEKHGVASCMVLIASLEFFEWRKYLIWKVSLCSSWAYRQGNRICSQRWKLSNFY